LMLVPTDHALDCPFDARLIPRPSLNLPDIKHGDTRLLIDLHIVSDGIIRGLRGITLPPELTLEFLAAVQNQLASPKRHLHPPFEWSSLEPVELVKTTTMRVCGK
jgi:hypothetical protein